MDQEILLEARKLLEEPPKLEEIPIQRAVSALGVSAITLGQNHNFGEVAYLNQTNLYLYYDGHAARDKNGNYDSPIFQNDRYNHLKPLWQEFRERVKAEMGISVSQILFGDYKVLDNKDEEFIVKSEPKDCRWRCTKKPVKKPANGSIFITAMSRKQALAFQAILDEIRLERALEIVIERRARAESRLCREEAITVLNGKYPDEFERFTFDEEDFRFRQFDVRFLYTENGLEAFDNFYQKSCIPYRADEIDKAEWEDKSHKLQGYLMGDESFGSEFRKCGVGEFKIRRCNNGGCEIDIDMIDDRFGQPFHMFVESQRFDDIVEAVSTELAVVFQRKRQINRATAHLQQWAAKK